MPEEIMNEHAEQNQEVSERLKAYICTSCGAEFLCADEAKIGRCPFCDAETFIADDQFHTAMPDSYLPFKISQDEAAERCRKFCGSRLMLPASFTRQLDTTPIRGIFIPFWLYSGTAKVNASFRVTDAGRPKIISESAVLKYLRLPICGSSKIKEPFQESILPYHSDELEPFSPKDLHGFVAESFEEDTSDAADNEDGIGDLLRSIGAEETQAGSKAVLDLERDVLSNEAARIMRSGLPCIIDSEISRSAILNNETSERILVPLWHLHTTWKGKEYTFCVNGQTGDVRGEFPFNHLQMLRLEVFSFLASLPVIFLLLMLVCLGISQSLETWPVFAAISAVVSVSVAFFFTYRFMLSLMDEDRQSGGEFYTTFFATTRLTDVSRAEREP